MKNLLVLYVVVSLTLSVFGADRLVPTQYSTIQSAIDSAMAGDTIVIASGTYSGNSNSNLHISINKPLVIRSTDPTNFNIVADTIIDCFDTSSGYNPAFTIESGASVIIDGLTILDGYNNQGGGIIFRNSFAVVRNCVFENCMAWNGGGTIYSENSIIQLSNCIFRDSYSDTYGGTISCNNSKIEILNCTIEGAFARSEGGAMYCNLNSNISLQGCTFYDNWSQRNGGALYAYNSKLSIKGCNFLNNTAFRQETFMGGAVYVENSTVNGNLLIKDSNFSDNFSSGSGGALYTKKLSIEVTGCYFTGNTSQQTGGGIYCDSNMTVTNSVITGNSANGGSAIQCINKSQNSTVIRNCTFADNSSSTRLPSIVSGGKIEVLNSIFWGSSGQFFSFPETLIFNYNDVQSGKFPYGAGIDNIQLDPMFVKAGDYHIKFESPIINAGDPNTILINGETDIDGNPRNRLGRVDMGAYEAASNPMDFDQNGIVNFMDLNRIAEAWLWEAAWYNK